MLPLTELKQVIQSRWDAFAPRERKMIKLLMLVLGLFLVYIWLWQPLHTRHQQALQQLQVVQEQWNWLNQQLPEIAQVRAQGNTTGLQLQTQSQLLAHLQQTLRSANLTNQMTAIRPVNDAIQIQFNQVVASQLIVWIARLESQGVVADSMQIEPISEGLVKATLNYRVSQ
ncbi:type II secretion system protein GspM [Thiomicrospira cyclica]|uniref:General secretion pathway M protein n=1 Tax=Thiomicrospira cyclica (strain DSM 14477 / JCM 11371 / ALM1) TaxID=717773 RepID=F6DD28_THICA|nr:type II secretion system protein GspM [Thiomicrospira cyclica]AEG31764.1 General secretion pathway M protein [Thiomicrospira cyclica ALM1]